MSKEAEDGVLTAIYINKMRALGWDSEYAFMHLVGALSITAGPKIFAEALQNAYISLEQHDPPKVSSKDQVFGSSAEVLFSTGVQQGAFLERERIIKLLQDNCEKNHNDPWNLCDCFWFIALIKGEQK